MTAFAITRSFNEVDIIESSIRRMLGQVDHVIVGDNSTDGTREVLDALAAEHADALTVLEDTAPSIAQRDVMTRYALRALEAGADWVIPFDIDEVWLADEGRISDRLAELPAEVLIAPARLVTHCVTDQDDLADPDPLSRMQWRDRQILPLPKVACRTRSDLRIDHGNHSARYERQRFAPAIDGILGARHFPYRSPQQFITRVRGAWPQLRDSGLPESHGAHMWGYGRHLDLCGEDGLREWFNSHMTFPAPASRPELVHDPLPKIELSIPALVF